MSLVDPDLYRCCLDHHRDLWNAEFLVQNSIPIPYFGDVVAYKKSPLKVLTAALNPSDREFPADGHRFDIAQGLNGPDELEAELSAYFGRNPYSSWFRSFEPVLNGLGASYGGVMADHEHCHTALHLDMCSPIATSPTWSRLTPDDRATLTTTGREVFERFVDALKPDIVIASLSWGHIEEWHADFRAGRDWEAILTYMTASNGTPLRTPLRLQAHALKSRSGHRYLFANGSAANTPFGRFHNDRKRAAGSTLLSHFRDKQ
jgi:hypothetical protein